MKNSQKIPKKHQKSTKIIWATKQKKVQISRNLGSIARPGLYKLEGTCWTANRYCKNWNRRDSLPWNIIFVRFLITTFDSPSFFGGIIFLDANFWLKKKFTHSLTWIFLTQLSFKKSQQKFSYFSVTSRLFQFLQYQEGRDSYELWRRTEAYTHVEKAGRISEI